MKGQREAELRQASEGVITRAKLIRAQAKERVKERQARERVAALHSLFLALERVAISEVSLNELCMMGNSVALKGEISDVSTLQVFLSDLGQHLRGARITIESTKGEALNQDERRGQFTVRVFFFARPHESSNRDQTA
jgi:hypothetical protein